MLKCRHTSCLLAGTCPGRHRLSAIVLKSAMYVSYMALMSEALKECHVPARRATES